MSPDILIGKHRIPIYQTQKATFCFEFAIKLTLGNWFNTRRE